MKITSYNPFANVFLTIRLLYFLYFMAFGVFVTFIDIYFRSIGFTGVQIGTINSVMALVGIIASPIWGALSDRLGEIRYFLTTATLGSALFAFGIYFSPSFLWIIPIVAIFAFFRQPLLPLMDSATMKLLHERPELYGRQRAWGTFGFLVSTWGFGYLLMLVGLNWLFAYFISASVLMAFFVQGLPKNRDVAHQFSLPNLWQVVKQRNWFFFMASIFVLGIGNVAMVHFLGIHLQELGGSEALIGTAAGVGALVELPILFWGAPLIRRFGAWRMLFFAYIVSGIRWLLYGFMPSPEWAIPISLLHGITFGIYWIASISYVNGLAPGSIIATAQGLFYAAFGLSSVIGSPINGYLFDTVGAMGLFRLSALTSIVACILLWIGKPATTIPTK